MPAPATPKDEVLTRLTTAFRHDGYEGASLARLSEATGLGKASLYHYFPGGKAEMAAAVLDRGNRWLEVHALAPLSGPGEPRERLLRMVAALDRFYAGGRDACLLGILALGDARTLFQEHIKAALQSWANAIAAVLEDAGMPPNIAAERAELAIIEIQGALVVSRGLSSVDPFARMLRDLPDRLLASVPPGK